MKKLALFVSLIVLCFSFTFAGCSSRRVHIDGVTVTSNKPSFETGNMFEAEDTKEYYSTNNAMYVLSDSPFVGVCVVSGGTFFATGVFSVGGAFQNSEQAYLYAYLTQQNAGETVKISTRGGEVLKEVVAGRVVKLVVYSSGKLIRGKEYVVACGNDSTIVQAL